MIFSDGLRCCDLCRLVSFDDLGAPASVPRRVAQFADGPTVLALDYLYFSMVTYTSLGLGDVYPKDHLRFMAGVEAINGLLLIAWSASVIFREANGRRH